MFHNPPAADDPNNQGIDPFTSTGLNVFSAPAGQGAERNPPPLHPDLQGAPAVTPMPQVLDERSRTEVRDHLNNVLPGMITPPPAHQQPQYSQPQLQQPQQQLQQPQQQLQQPQQQAFQQPQQQQAPPPPPPPPPQQPQQQQQAPTGMYIIAEEELERRILVSAKALYDQFRRDLQEVIESVNIEFAALVHAISERSPKTIQSMEDYQQLREWAINNKIMVAQEAQPQPPAASQEAQPPAEDAPDETATDEEEAKEDPGEVEA